jgi:uridylate kinase
MAGSGYKRVLLKLSGEALAGEGRFGIHVPKLNDVATKMKAAHDPG